MTLQELIDLYEFGDIEGTFKFLYDHTYLNNSVGYEKVYETLKDIDDVMISSYSISIEHISEEEADWHHLSGKLIGSDTTYSLSFTPWREWLGMEIDSSTFSNYSNKEILCHCLWEMTYWGFTEKKVQENSKFLDEEEFECLDEESESLDFLMDLLKEESSSDSEE